jgi:hypothetical protein
MSERTDQRTNFQLNNVVEHPTTPPTNKQPISGYEGYLKKKKKHIFSLNSNNCYAVVSKPGLQQSRTVQLKM